ncbi:hypothetical protein E0H51_25795 [Rhizobium leguminosarum bv. viciae]|jgi:hypothetical protein|uniref:hypothetical protein n=1 Tax=Rhizobium leguminosarum TaxID=384 RepID=UPI00037D18C7|nr:hypothetical protein [Rhizobium leguminosarum]MBY5751081.1 hypothetical protein [Rhizobium leguminosarum]MBY5826070.1 hypothetical protein [Rhizobium leguminosarum]TBY73296.1 hypothetical protein E0H51_25795 [Rhizobium leguminosarum bv. viciae]TCA10974.1 hypothetical protein E0H57_02070 [Rhizobium leguminosarum bv. viciae]
MRLGSIFRYAQLLVVTLLVAANPFGMAAAPSTLQSQHCAAVGERHHHAGHAYGTQAGCCPAMHCCPILPELAKVAAPRFEPGRHERTEPVDRPLLLIRSIDPPPRFQAG